MPEKKLNKEPEKNYHEIYFKVSSLRAPENYFKCIINAVNRNRSRVPSKSIRNLYNLLTKFIGLINMNFHDSDSQRAGNFYYYDYWGGFLGARFPVIEPTFVSLSR